VYIESGAYASNLKQKLACGSLLLALRIDHWEFYSRLLRPGLEYVEVDDAEEGLCERVSGWLGG
jgi:protein glucosyltransferase